MKKLTLFLTIIWGCNFAVGYQIKLPDAPKPWENTAAQELESYLERTVRSFSLAGKPLGTIYVGDTEFAAGQNLSSDGLPPEKWVIRSVGNDLILVGGGTRGTIYATSKFLEEVIGCRFFTVGEEYVPEADDYNLEKLAREGKPFFERRCIYYPQLPRNDGRFRALRLLNIGRIEMAYGGGAESAPSYMHNMVSHYIPKKKYFTEHPEYYALGKDGERTAKQLCLSNKEMRREFIRNVKALVEKTNKRTSREGLPKVTHYNIAQEDGGTSCSCPDCREFVGKHRHGGLLVDFLNEIAAELSAIDPELVIDTYAYVFSAKPPINGIKAADNIIFRVCNTHGSNHLTGESINFPGLLEGWGAVASRLAVHEYGRLFGFLPEFPWSNEFSFPVITRLWADNKVSAVYNELCSNLSSDFAVMKYYMFSKYLEDPYREDFDNLMEDFCMTYYGAAGAEILEYRRCLKRLSDQAGSKISWMCSKDAGHARYIDIDAMLELQELFERAEAKVSDDKARLARVHRDRQGLDWTLGIYLFRFYQDQWAMRYPGKKFPFDLKVVRERCESSFNYDMRAPDASTRINKALTILDHNPEVTLSPRFSDVPHADIAAFEVTGGTILVDPDAETGFAAHRSADRVAPGIYHVMRAKKFVGQTFADFSPEAIAGTGYNWYKIAAGRLADEGTGSNLILSSSWSLQASLAHLPIDYAKPFEIWARFKVSGPSYKIANESGVDELWLDRVVILNKE